MIFNNIQDILIHATEKEASDVHLIAGSPPVLRIDGEVRALDSEPLTGGALKEMLFTILTDQQRGHFVHEKELDFSFSYIEGYHFRINIHYGAGKIGAAIRVTATKLKTIEELHLPDIVNQLARKRKGLIVLSGTAGSGKSTTMTYMLNKINQERQCKVITIEDPIEFYHTPNKSFFLQREVGVDTDDFHKAMKYSFRQDPDVLAIGEMRDLESISMALTTSETGHLVLTTTHASDAVETINRIIDAYPVGNKEQILTQLAGNLQAIMGQMLIPMKDGVGRVLCTEIMLNTVAVQNLIRRGALMEIRGLMDSNEIEGMHSFEVSLSKLYRNGSITKEAVLEHAKYPKSLKLKGDGPFGRASTFQDDRFKEQNSGQEDQDSQTDGSSGDGKRVLVIDADRGDVQKMSQVLIDTFGCEIVYADKGSEAMMMIEEDCPDLIVSETSLPDMVGFELVRKIRAIVKRPVGIVLCARHLKVNDPESAKAAGADDFVIKTFEYDLLCRAVRKILAPKR